jgi:putative DNA primase/helicase
MDSSTSAPEMAPQTNFLLPCHREELRASGLSDDTIAASGFYTEMDHTRLASILGWRHYPAKHGPGLVLVYRDELGSVVLQRVKLTNPRTRSGKPIKYEQPVGARLKAYFPPHVYQQLQDTTARLFITEGEKKALCLTQHGWPCIGLAGVEAWHEKQSASLLPELERIDWSNRRVYIAFDSDAINNSTVLAAESKLAYALKARGASVQVVRIPPGADDKKQGADDFLVNENPAAFERLVEQAEEPQEVHVTDMKPSAKWLDGAMIAAEIVQEMTVDKVCTLRFWNGGWWLWRGGAYRPRPDQEVTSEVVRILATRFAGVKPEHVNCVLMHLRSQTSLSSNITAPTWLGEAPSNWRPNDCVALRDSIVHLPTLAAGGEARIDASPKLFTVAACDFDFNPDPPRPDAWLSFLDSVWGNDQDAINTLQEILGYLLTSDTRQHKIFMLIGPPRSGKGTIQRLIYRLVGQENCCGPTLGSLGECFGLSPLLGKTVAIVSDARLSGRGDSALVLERLLSISGEDTLTINIKFKEPINTKLLTRLVLMSNELPRLNDSSSAIVSRMVILHMTRSFLGSENRNLDAELAAELQAIWWWSAEGWRRLNERGCFLQPESGQEQLDELRDLASPVGAFVRERCELGEGYTVPVPELFEEWRQWCGEQGRDYAGNTQSFGRDLLAACPSIRRTRTGPESSRVRGYRGIRVAFYR